MACRIQPILFAFFLIAQSCLIQAMPVDVDGDGKVGPLELIDLSLNWKGPALPTGVQPWQFNGSDIYYSAGKVGIGSATPHHQLRISGGPAWTTARWIGSLELDNEAAIGWQANNEGLCCGIGHTNNALCFFRTASDPGTAGEGPFYDMLIYNDGKVWMNNGLEIGAQEGLRIAAYQPFLTLHDTNKDRRSVIQGVDGNIHFYPNDFIGFSPPVSIFNSNGNMSVGTSTPDPRARLYAVTGESGGYAVKGDAPNGTGVYATTNSNYGGDAAVVGIGPSSDRGGWVGLFVGAVHVTGGLYVEGGIHYKGVVLYPRSIILSTLPTNIFPTLQSSPPS